MGRSMVEACICFPGTTLYQRDPGLRGLYTKILELVSSQFEIDPKKVEFRKWGRGIKVRFWVKGDCIEVAFSARVINPETGVIRFRGMKYVLDEEGSGTL
ncbi:MAG: hypothetical protein PHW75_00995 [Patescibacteria group bacterium]|nr:hypothetical protein [Patescibacteria group bacterium]